MEVAEQSTNASLPMVAENEEQIQTEQQTQKKKKKPSLTQPRTQSKQSQSSNGVSLVMSSTIASSYQSKGNHTAQNSTIEKSGDGDQSGYNTSENSEDLDKVYPLPDGWPRLHNKIFRRKALFFRKPLSPNIAKAAEHLRQLQDRIEAWSREVELDILSRHSDSIAESRASSSMSSAIFSEPYRPTTDNRGRKMIRFEETPRLDDRSSIQGSRAPSFAGSSQDLSVHGLGAVLPQAQEIPLITDEEIPHLGAEGVIEEVFVLMGRLETDRADTVTSYDKEQKRVEWLQSRIDKLAWKRMTELPKVVQKEHEACATDIAELKWHCSYRGRQLSRQQNQMDVADVLNQRLKEDIAFVQKHCPLVEEKLDLEREAMKRIDEAQEQTTIELNKTIDKLHRTENKCHEANGKADKEREHIKHELDSVRDALSQISIELEQAKAMHASHVHTCQDVREKLKANDQENILLETKNENARKANKMKEAVVKTIQDQIIDAEFSHRKHTDHNFQLTDQTERMRSSFETIQKELEDKTKVTLADLREKQSRCRELNMEIEDTEIKLKDCTRQRVADSKNMDRISREMNKVEQQLSVTDEEHEKIKVINGAIKNKLIGEEDKALSSEESLKGVAETLKKQVKEETHSRTVMQARIASDTTDLAKQQVEAKKKKVKVSKKAKELEEIANGILADVEVLRNRNADRVQSVIGLETSISDLKNLHTETEDSLTNLRDELRPKCKALQPSVIVSVTPSDKSEQQDSLPEEDLKLQKRLDYMAYRSDLINKKLADMSQSSGYMEKVIKTTEEAIEEIAEEMEEMEIQLEVGKKQAAQLKASMSEVDDREKQGDNRHLEHMKAREKVLKDKEADLRNNLQINKELAHTYRVSQNVFYDIKNALLDTFEHRVGLESSLKDHKQLNGLQLRLHQALSRYYYIRGLYNANELARFDEISVENSERINTLQKEMDIAIETISKFLTDQLDGTAARMVAAAARSVLTGSISRQDDPDMKVTRQGRDTLGASTKDGRTTLRGTTRDGKDTLRGSTRGTLMREGTMVGAATTGRKSRVTIST